MRTIGWSAFWLLVIDLSCTALVTWVADDYDHRLYRIADYLDRGRSVPGKLRRNIIPNKNVIVGWPRAIATPGPEKGPERIDVFGMSFGYDLISRVAAAEPNRFSVQYHLGPGATLSQSYAAFSAYKEELGDYAVLAILSSSLPFIQATSYMTWTTEYPYVAVYPRYAVRDGTLMTEVEAPFETGEAFRAAGSDLPGIIDYVKATDPFYGSLPFVEFGDSSTLARFIKRALVVRAHESRMADHFDPKKGFIDGQDVALARAIIQSFASESREAGARPVVVLIGTRGQGAFLNSALAGDWQACVFRTHPMADSNDPRAYMADGHFTHEQNDELATALLKQCFAAATP